MSQYTTGEMAKACGVTVRTVQFYDQKGILVPGSLTEGGRRQYSEEDLKMIKNFGAKSMDEIKERLAEMNLSLGMKI